MELVNAEARKAWLPDGAGMGAGNGDLDGEDEGVTHVGGGMTGCREDSVKSLATYKGGILFMQAKLKAEQATISKC